MILASGALLKRDMRKGMEMGKSRVIALLAVASIVATACSGSSNSASPSPAAPTGAVPSTGASSAASAPAASPVVGTSPTPNVDTTVYNRATTLYTSGKQWGAPSTWNPLDPNAAMGVVGLQYETLFLFDPLKFVYTPWLASALGTWDIAKLVYTVKVRSGVKWTDGTDFTATDVAFTINLGLTMPSLGSSLPQAGLKSAVASDASTVVVTFAGKPAYQEWAQWLYNSPILPEHIWKTE